MSDLPIRLSDLDLTRATEQASLFLTLARSFHPRGMRRRKVEEVSTLGLFGSLSHAHCQGEVLFPDTEWVTPPPSTFGHGPPCDPSWKLHFVLSPVDGRRAFVDCYDSGSISVLAGGFPGSFIAEDKLSAKNYLVLAMSSAKKEGLGSLIRDALDRRIVRQADGQLLTTNDTKIEAKDFLQRTLPFLSERTKKKAPWTTSTLGEGQEYSKKELRQVLQEASRTRVFNGSSVAASFAVYLPQLGIDAFAGVVRRTQTILIAVVAKATGEDFLAIPLEKTTKKPTEPSKTTTAEKKKPHIVPPEKATKKPTKPSKTTTAKRKKPHIIYNVRARSPVYQKDILVPGEDVFLCSTAITENLILRGVRFADDKVATHTLSLRSRTKSTRFISQQHDLSQKSFRFEKPTDELGTWLGLFARGGMELRVIYLHDPRAQP